MLNITGPNIVYLNFSKSSNTYKFQSNRHLFKIFISPTLIPHQTLRNAD